MWSVRPARPPDAAGVAAVHVRSWQVAYRDLLPAAYLDALRPEDRMEHYTFGSSDPDVPVTIVAVEDQVIIGFATTGPAPDDETGTRGALFGLYLDPDAWGRGVGRRLLAESRARLAGRGCTEAELWVLVGNVRAERFYRIDGWVTDDRPRRQEIWGVTVDEIRYRRHLP